MSGLICNGTTRGLLLGAAFALGLSACEGEEGALGVDEPLVAATPTVFKKGKLPGQKADDQPVVEGPQVSFSIQGRIQQGASGLTLDGTGNSEAYAAGFRFADEGSGYWLATMGAEDLFQPGSFKWGATLDIGFDIDPGPHDIIAVGFDKKGKPGKQIKSTVCVQADLFDNGNACNATIAPPAAVAVLRWNSKADLDLSVLSPESVRYDLTNFFQIVDKKTVAELMGDSSPTCAGDGRHSETFVWHEQPPTGTWYLYANLFDVCGQASVDYELTIYRRRDHGDGTFSLKEEKTFGGAFTRNQIQTDSAHPLYLTTIKFP